MSYLDSVDARNEDRTYRAAGETFESPDDASMADQRECIARALMILRRRVERAVILGDSGDTRKWLTLELAGVEREVFGIITLDAHHRMIGKHDLFFGSVDRARVYPREVLKACLRDNAAECIAYHNHPSGIAKPSASDREITFELRELLKQIDVTMPDHIVVAGGDSASFAEEGWL